MKTATRLIHLLVVSSLALLALASCDYVPLVSTVVKHNKASQDMWSVRLNVSGGFAGVRQSIEVDSEGMMVIQDERRFIIKNRQLSGQQISQYRRWLQKVPEEAQKNKPSPKCCDHFQYSLLVRRDNLPFIAQFDSMQLSSLPYVSLIQGLNQALSAALKEG